ncbi:unnamed protein product [Pylaiella littoralis]
MGCSSSRIPLDRPQTNINSAPQLATTPAATAAAAAATTATPTAGGGAPKATAAHNMAMEDLEITKPDYKTTLILKKNQSSLEGRQNQSLVQNLVHDEFRRQITEVYDMNEGSLLGKGGFGTVQTVVHRQSGKKYALKAVELSRVKDEKSLEFFFREVEVMRKLDHPNICRLHAVYPTVEHLFMVMDLCEGGDLLTTYHFKSEQDAANIVLKVTNAVRYMHDRSIAHRDLKLDNILTNETKEGVDVQLVDFGLSAHFDDFKLEHDVVGTWVYMAPEVISGSHFPRTCDMWSIGVISYLLLCGYPPFGGSSTAELKENIQHGTYQFHHDAWSSISGKAKNFIKRLLVRNPQERMSAAEAQHHPWLNNHDPSGKEQKLSEGALANLVAFRTTNVLKRLALELVARSLDQEQIRNLEKEFAKMDRDGSGTISLEEFDRVLSSQADLSKADIHALFASVDVDNGNAVNFNEFLAATLERRELDERRLKLAFDRLDYDHSGTIDSTDLRNIVGSDLGQEGIDEIFTLFDLNRDGEIDFSEFKLAMRKADAPTVRLATYRPSSMPHIKVNSQSMKVVTFLSLSLSLSFSSPVQMLVLHPSSAVCVPVGAILFFVGMPALSKCGHLDANRSANVPEKCNVAVGVLLYHSAVVWFAERRSGDKRELATAGARAKRDEIINCSVTTLVLKGAQTQLEFHSYLNSEGQKRVRLEDGLGQFLVSISRVFAEPVRHQAVYFKILCVLLKWLDTSAAGTSKSAREIQLVRDFNSLPPRCFCVCIIHILVTR